MADNVVYALHPVDNIRAAYNVLERNVVRAVRVQIGDRARLQDQKDSALSLLQAAELVSLALLAVQCNISLTFTSTEPPSMLRSMQLSKITSQLWSPSWTMQNTNQTTLPLRSPSLYPHANGPVAEVGLRSTLILPSWREPWISEDRAASHQSYIVPRGRSAAELWSRVL